MDNNRGDRQATAEEREIELMKRQLLPSMSEDMEAALKHSNESAGDGRCSIFRVPRGIAGGIAAACRPRTISIGPYHHRRSHLQKFQGHKWTYLHAMLGRTRFYGIGLGNLIDVVAPKEKMIRQCYSDSTGNFTGSDLVKMMVLDGCFIVELFRQLKHVVPPNPGPILYNTYVITSVMQDLLLLENQIPYFVLEDLFEMTNVPRITWSFVDLTLNVLSGFLKGPGNVDERGIDFKGVHLLDLFRLSLIPSEQQDDQGGKSSSFHMIRSASELHRVGVGFEQRKASTFLGIEFDNKRRIIGIPKITVDDDDLNWILPNMVAFEQCRGCPNDSHVTAYAMFMGCLVHTVDDVQLLRDCKVISNHGMSNDDFADFFADIRKAAPFDVKGSYLASQFANLNESLKHERAHYFWALLLNAFHDNPWSALSGLAIVVTVVGIIQTVYAVLQYHYPK